MSLFSTHSFWPYHPLSFSYVDFSSLPYATFVFWKLGSRCEHAQLSLVFRWVNTFPFVSALLQVILISFLALSLQYHHDCQYTPFKTVPNAEAPVVSTLPPLVGTILGINFGIRSLLLPSLQSWRMLSLSACDGSMIYRKGWQSVLLMKMVSTR